MTTIAEELPCQQERCRKILEHALEMQPPYGWFLVTSLRIALREAEQAAASGDLVRMIRAYASLTECDE